MKFEPGRQLRALRRRSVLSQRELADAAGVHHSVIGAIESGRRNPGLAQFDRIVRAAGYQLTVVAAGTELGPDDTHDAIRDRGGRRFPAHLKWDGRPEYQAGRWWWGWHRIAKYSDDQVPDHVYWQRPREPRGPIREHPWFGPFHARGLCRAPADEPCGPCAGDCRYDSAPGAQSRPSDGPPEPPPA